MLTISDVAKWAVSVLEVASDGWGKCYGCGGAWVNGRCENKNCKLSRAHFIITECDKAEQEAGGE